MAAKSNTKKSFYEVVFTGKPKVVRAFMKGFVMGTLDNAMVIYSFNSGVWHEGKGEKLAEMVGIRGTDCHVIVDSKTSALLKKRTRRIANETGLEITSHRFIRSASMSLKFQTYARKYNDEIVELVRNLPAGLRVDGFHHDVRLDPKAKGVESYATAHHYEANGEATIVGRVDLLVDLKKKFADYPLIQSDDIVLKLA